MDYSSSSDNGTWNKTRFLDEVNIDIPIFEKQMQLVQVYEKIVRPRERLETICRLIKDVIDKQLGYAFVSYQGKDVPISEILCCLSGNSGLTEEYLYSQIQDKSPRIYRILTGSINYEKPQYASKCSHPKNALRDIVTIDGKDVIHVVRKGINAGFAAYFEKGNYTINDDTYLLYLKDNLPWALNLKWLMHTLKPRFMEFTSSSDNKTWNKGKFFKEVKLDIPSVVEQNQIFEVYNKIEKLEEMISSLCRKIEGLLKKQIAQD